MEENSVAKFLRSMANCSDDDPALVIVWNIDEISELLLEIAGGILILPFPLPPFLDITTTA
jgi:hypothetical protein